MKKSFLTIAIVATAAFTMASCGNKTDNKEGGDSIATEQAEGEEAQAQPKGFTWDYNEGSPLQDVDNIEYVLYAAGYDRAQKEGKDPANEIHIYYTAKLVEAGDKVSTVKSLAGQKYEVPNSLIIPIYKGAKAKKGDIVLTWWQSGSGKRLAIVTDAANPETPTVKYLGQGERGNSETLKPNSFNVLTQGKWEPGQPAIVKNDGDEIVATLLNVDGDKVLYHGFADKVYVAKKSDVKLHDLKPNFKEGDNVKYEFVGKYKDGAVVKKYDAERGVVFINTNSREDNKSFYQVYK